MDQQIAPFTREIAHEIVKKYLKNPNLIKHSYAAEAVMRALYKRLNKDTYSKEFEDMWGITGLLHDADYEMAKGHPEIHGILITEKEPSIPPDIAYAIKAHNFEKTLVLPKSPMDWAIACCDQLTGLIVAAALIHPDKKLATITPEFVLNRFSEKSFAKGADRKAIERCEEKLGIPLREFVEISLKAMQEISDSLEL